MDHGYEIDPNKRCSATTKKDRPCSLNALAGISLCALHAGLARPRGNPEYGSAAAMVAYKKGLIAPTAPRRPVLQRP